MSLIRVKHPGEAWSSSDESVALPDWWDLTGESVEFSGTVTINPAGGAAALRLVTLDEGSNAFTIRREGAEGIGDPGLSFGMYEDGADIVSYFNIEGTEGTFSVESSQGFGLYNPNGDILWLVQPGGEQLMRERTDPSAPGGGAAGDVKIYARDNGSGKTQLCARFASGAVQVFATQP